MKLLVDVGNTTINLGLAQGKEIVDTWRLHTNPAMTAVELWHQWTSLTDNRLTENVQMIVASVVPELTGVIEEMARDRLRESPYFLSAPWDPVTIGINTEHPDEVGADRVAGAVAMAREYGEGIVVDFGTATTVDYIDDGPAYRGGVIFPGLQAASRGLSVETALLPSMSLRDPVEFQFQNTQQALESGLLYGTAGSVTRIINEFRARGLPDEAPVVATGGSAEIFLDVCEEITDYEPNLVLRGLLMISEEI